MWPRPPFVLLEDRIAADAGGRLLSDPAQVLTCTHIQDVTPQLQQAERLARDGLHVAGYVAYEAGAAFEPRLAAKARLEGRPLLWLAAFRQVQSMTAMELDAAFGAMPPDAPIENLRLGHDRQAHVEKVRRILDLIEAGDLYQANLTFRVGFDYRGDPLGLYAALRAQQPVAHGGLVVTGEDCILSISPELFVEVTAGRVRTRPMKGTAGRGQDAADDAAQARALRRDPKQLAENLMIVDLLRNDLSRVCRPGTVEVPALFELETYPSLHTLTSTVEGDLMEGVGFAEVMRALFPCGSIVGAPKIRAAEVLYDLEADGRGVYTGAVGLLAPGGDLKLNVAIRTLRLQDGQGAYGVGGGIVADSRPDAEFEEAVLKAAPLTRLATDFQLLETLRWSGGGLPRLEAHLARLASSSATLGFQCDLQAVRAALRAAAEDWGAGTERRVRIALSREGGVAIESEAISPDPADVVQVRVATPRLDAGDPFLRHKTSRRQAYDEAWAEAAAAGAGEALLLNQRGEIADGARSTIFLKRDDVLETPPLAAGALAGVLRAELLTRGEARERTLTLSELTQGDLFIGNSLRGLRRARLAGEPR